MTENERDLTDAVYVVFLHLHGYKGHKATTV